MLAWTDNVSLLGRWFSYDGQGHNFVCVIVGAKEPVDIRATHEHGSVKRANRGGGGQALMRLRPASVIAALSLLAWAATASAECAWVFWLEAGDARTHESSSRPVSGWGTREACEQALTQKLASDSERDTEMDVTVDRQAGRPRLWLRRKGHPEPLAVYSYVCLPDTVDPRGPQGKP